MFGEYFLGKNTTWNSSCVGGIAGKNSGGNVILCKNKKSILASGYSEAGGIVGYSRGNGTIKKCSNYVDIVNENEYTVGGIAGYTNKCTIEECFNIGNITGKSCVGGIVGQTSYTTTKNCYNTASITGDKSIGGIEGKVDPYEYKVGYEYLYNCYNIGMISGNSEKDCWVGAAQYLTWNYIYTTDAVYTKVGEGTWKNSEGTEYDHFSGTDSVIKSNMLTNLLNGNGSGKWTRDTTGKINNGYPYLVNNVPE